MIKPSYSEELSEKMAQIFYRCEDFMLNLASPIPTNNPRRQQILAQTYLMQKKGKTLGTLEQRAIRIHQGQLKQIDKSGQERDLPLPRSIGKQSLVVGTQTQWNLKDHPYRIFMQFQQRSPIFVYFKSPTEVDEVYSLLFSKTHPQIKYTLDKAYQKYYKEKLVNYFTSKISTIKLSKNFGGIEKKRLTTLQKVRGEFQSDRLVSQLLLEWHKRAVTTAKDPQKIEDNQISNMLDVKHVVSELCFSMDRLKSPSDFPTKSGEVKLWVGQMTHNKTIKFSLDQIAYEYLETFDNSGNKTKLKIATSISLGNTEIKLRNQTPPLNIWTTLQFQAETKNEEGQNKTWRSDRLYVIDFLKSLTKGPKKVINLWGGKTFQQLWITGKSAKSQVLKVSLPPEHQYFPSSYTYKLTPNIYPILSELIPKTILSKYIKSITPQTIHLQYTIAYQEYLQNESIQSLCYSSFSKLYDLLQIDAIVEKFFIAQPYSQYSQMDNKGTFIYEFLTRKSAKFAYHDAEKFIWKYQCTRLRRFLSAIKAFDEFPRINYTEPFFFVCLQCMRIAEKQSLIKWRRSTFCNSLLGRESVAFFLVLGIVKSCSQLLLVQANKSTLSNNSLLLHYVLKKHNKNLYNKFLNLQLNIETLFGIQSASLFASLLDNSNMNGYGGSEEIFLFILVNCITERREQTARISQDNKNSKQNMKSNHYVSLVAAFLAILQTFEMVISCQAKRVSTNEIMGNSSAYSTANSYIQYLRIFASTQLQAYQPELVYFYNNSYGICLNELKDPQYITLQTNLDKFHEQHSLAQMNGSQLGNIKMCELIQQLYSEFSCCKPKNEEDIRKIAIILDSINLGEYLLNNNQTGNSGSSSYRKASLVIQVLQSSTKLYEHEYIIPHKQSATEPSNLTYENIKHQIEIKLNKLSPLFLILTYVHNNNVSSYMAIIDPKQIPSNYYIQQIKELSPVTVVDGSVQSKVTDLCCNNRYACMQIYIKDSSEMEPPLENLVPTSYINGLLLRGRVADNGVEDYRKDVIFCNNYFRSFRHMENNFNLLYAKLGWYGNHYLIPTDRITAMYLARHVTTQTTVSSHHPQAIADLVASNSPQYQLALLPELNRQRVNEILFYSRCIYGRGLVPSIAYVGSTGTQVMMQSLRNNRVVVKETKEIRNQINQCQFNSCSNLVGYLFDNFYPIGNASSQNFNDFYLRCTQQLPLLRYLSFHPLQFYLLEQIVFTLKVTPGQPHLSTSTLVKNKIMANLPFPRKAEEDVGSKGVDRVYQIILTNHPISLKHNDPESSKTPLKFITNPGYFSQELYTNYEAANLYSTKDLYMQLLQPSYLPPTIYFTYPSGIQYRMSHEDVQAIGAAYGVTGSTDMLVDQFLWLLQMNIIKYYLVDNKKQPENKKGKSHSKEKQAEKDRDKKNNVLGCQIKLRNSTLPNTSVSNFYQLICETKLQVELVACPITPIAFQEASSVGKNVPSLNLVPMILNQVYRHYTSFALYNGTWIEVCVLAKIMSPNHCLLYTEQKYTRKLRLFRSTDVVLGLEAKRMVDRLPCFKFTDHEVLAGKECVRKQLVRII